MPGLLVRLSPFLVKDILRALANQKILYHRPQVELEIPEGPITE